MELLRLTDAHKYLLRRIYATQALISTYLSRVQTWVIFFWPSLRGHPIHLQTWVTVLATMNHNLHLNDLSQLSAELYVSDVILSVPQTGRKLKPSSYTS